MSKLSYVLKASSELNEKTGAILLEVAKTNFIQAKDIREALPEISSASINSNIGVLIKKGFIEKSGDGLIATEQGTEVILKAADIFAEENPSKIKTTRKPRGVTEEMTKFAEKFKEISPFAIKGIFENRSNLELRLEKRVNGIRQFEVRHKGEMRVFGYKLSEELVEKYKSIGATVKFKGNNYYVDIKLTEENMIKVIEASK
ncbi:activator of middle transcription [Proteus phage vB_PmiM_Pm5461]|uniref:Activator of middle transcription n=1 Tax=Proteus phage vB_PmiM_Pm5461 TaxID=1636250 RepID=A0A0G2SSN1_9CAUD|nr:MotA-like activator of middle period transcription [Proteus phage vB_PmiM_Pm5461]AKA62111.1 activator of middle transcription [Proteus phage vB_PmiM_Pm5461]